MNSRKEETRRKLVTIHSGFSLEVNWSWETRVFWVIHSYKLPASTIHSHVSRDQRDEGKNITNDSGICSHLNPCRETRKNILTDLIAISRESPLKEKTLRPPRWCGSRGEHGVCARRQSYQLFSYSLWSASFSRPLIPAAYIFFRCGSRRNSQPQKNDADTFDTLRFLSCRPSQGKFSVAIRWAVTTTRPEAACCRCYYVHWNELWIFRLPSSAMNFHDDSVYWRANSFWYLLEDSHFPRAHKRSVENPNQYFQTLRGLHA